MLWCSYVKKQLSWMEKLGKIETGSWLGKLFSFSIQLSCLFLCSNITEQNMFSIKLLDYIIQISCWSRPILSEFLCTNKVFSFFPVLTVVSVWGCRKQDDGQERQPDPSKDRHAPHPPLYPTPSTHTGDEEEEKERISLSHFSSSSSLEQNIGSTSSS